MTSVDLLVNDVNQLLISTSENVLGIQFTCPISESWSGDIVIDSNIQDHWIAKYSLNDDETKATVMIFPNPDGISSLAEVYHDFVSVTKCTFPGGVSSNSFENVKVIISDENDASNLSLEAASVNVYKAFSWKDVGDNELNTRILVRNNAIADKQILNGGPKADAFKTLKDLLAIGDGSATEHGTFVENGVHKLPGSGLSSFSKHELKTHLEVVLDNTGTISVTADQLPLYFKEDLIRNQNNKAVQISNEHGINIVPQELQTESKALYHTLQAGKSATFIDSSNGEKVIFTGTDTGASYELTSVSGGVTKTENGTISEGQRKRIGSSGISYVGGSIFTEGIVQGAKSYGDPYVTPVYGVPYKLPSRLGYYRYLSDLKGDFVVNAQVFKLPESSGMRIQNKYDKLFKDTPDYLKLKTPVMVDGYYFKNFFIKNNNEKYYLDLEKLVLKNNNKNYKLVEEQYLDLGDVRVSVDNNIRDKKFYCYPEPEKIIKTINFEIETKNFGYMFFSFYIFYNSQIRTGVNFNSTSPITKEMSSGLSICYQRTKDIKVPRLTYSKAMNPCEYSKNMKIITEEFQTAKGGLHKVRMIQA